MGAAPLLGALLSIGQAAAGFAQASQQADEQNAYYEQNRLNAIAAANDRYAAVNRKILQDKKASGQELLEKRIEAMRKTATAEVAAAESGVTGLSVDALRQDFKAQQARREAAIVTNYGFKHQEGADELIATYHQTKGRIDSVRRASKPSPLPFILSGLGGAMGAFKA